MAHAAPPQTTGPKTWVKFLVTLLILWQFFAILSIVTAAGGDTHAFAPSRVVVQNVTLPYLEAIFLTNAYRFYAPNPGPIDLLWFRIEYENGSIRWHDMAAREQFASRMPYQRHVSLTMMIKQTASPDPTGGPDRYMLSPQGIIAVKSYVRHVVQNKATLAADGKPNPVKEVDVYYAAHAIMVPRQIRMGWESEDPRLYHATFIGTYDPSGNRLNTSQDPQGAARPYQTVAHDTSELMTQFVEDAQAELEAEGIQGEARLTSAFVKSLPAPARKLIATFPELLDPSPPGEGPRDRIVRLVESRDDPAEKAKAIPGIDYLPKW